MSLPRRYEEWRTACNAGIAKGSGEPDRISLCMVVELADKLELALEALEYIAYHVGTSPSDEDGGPCKLNLGNDRNDRILKARHAIEKIENDR